MKSRWTAKPESWSISSCLFAMQNRTMRRATRLLPAIVLLMFIGDAKASPRFYRDITTSSPNGHLRLEVRSPENDPPNPYRTSQRNFVYTLWDQQGERVLWTRKQPRDEASPLAAYVSDTGRVVVWTDRVVDELLVLDPKDGSVVLRQSILSNFLPAERERYVSQTSAGPMWAGHSHWYFADVDGREYFVVRPWWGSRLVLDLETGQMGRPSESIAPALKSQETSFALTTLRKVVDEGLPAEDDPQRPDKLYRIETAALISADLGVQEAVPLLREIEAWEREPSGGLMTLSARRVPANHVDPFNYYSTYELRRFVQLCVRKLGERPSGLPATMFYFGDERSGRKPVTTHLPAPRSRRVDLLKLGMRPREVLETLGAPDFVRERTWEYDMDAQRPYTLTITWNRKGRRVQQIRRIAPARWEQGDLRYQDTLGPGY